MHLADEQFADDHFRDSYGALGTRLTNADASNPKLRQLSSEEKALGGYSSETVEIGPLTPSHAAGGTDLTTIAGEVCSGATRCLLITGPGYPENGARFAIKDIDTTHALRFMITAERVASDGQDQAGG